MRREAQASAHAASGLFSRCRAEWTRRRLRCPGSRALTGSRSGPLDCCGRSAASGPGGRRRWPRRGRLPQSRRVPVAARQGWRHRGGSSQFAHAARLPRRPPPARRTGLAGNLDAAWPCPPAGPRQRHAGSWRRQAPHARGSDSHAAGWCHCWRRRGRRRRRRRASVRETPSSSCTVPQRRLLSLLSAQHHGRDVGGLKFCGACSMGPSPKRK